ncbi:MAG: phosphate/phosphite/phosphonate ABC transporter substrate-binding protein [Leptolyngbyaceae cyanobacterium MAG.088]|nr:phosphate/phosphite/phosphonate ABC transporter substrate-binding protein [Leptolyngbyaceae cyanobacterium MAG.088]
MLNRRIFLSYSLLFLGGCATAQTTTAVSTSQGNRPSRLRFAVTDISDADELEQDFGPFRQTLEAVLELPVEFFPVANFVDAAPALLANELDFAMAGPSEYLLLKARANAVPIAGVTRSDYYSVFVTLADSDIATLADLKGKKIAMWSEGATAGHIVPTKMLLDAGLQADAYEAPMLGKDSVEALFNGQVDAWVTSHTRYKKTLTELGRKDDVKIIAKSEHLPPDIFVASPSLGESFLEELKSKLTTRKDTLIPALYESGANQKFKGSDMILVDDSNYQTLRDTYYAIGYGSAIE